MSPPPATEERSLLSPSPSPSHLSRCSPGYHANTDEREVSESKLGIPLGMNVSPTHTAQEDNTTTKVTKQNREGDRLTSSHD